MQGIIKINRFLDTLLNNLNIAREMIRKGFDINAFYNQGETPLKYAISRRNLSAVQFLIQHGAELTRQFGWPDSSPLFDAIFEFNDTTETCAILNLLLENGVDCNETSYYYGPPLLYALEHKSLACVQLLLNHGADIEAEGEGGKKSLHYAVKNSQVYVIQLILDQGFDVDSCDYFGSSALHQAILQGNAEACELLLKNGASVRKRNSEDRTPLALAVAGHRVPEAITQVLLRYGANVSDKVRGESILKIAMKSSRTVTKRLLVQMAKMKYLNININECDRQIMQNNDEYRSFFVKCLQEIRYMKEARFHNDVSIFDIFMESQKMILRYARNEELVEALEGGAYEKRFPIHFTYIKEEFYARVEKHRLRRSAAGTLGHLFLFNDPNHIVNQMILSYMRDADLRFLGM